MVGQPREKKNKKKMNYQELNGSKLRKDLEVAKVRKRYHNKHIDGSGNFGFTVIDGGNWYTLDGEYVTSGILARITFGTYGFGNWFKNIYTPEYNRLITYIKKLIATNSNA